jgi:hypothetical protein
MQLYPVACSSEALGEVLEGKGTEERNAELM